jgi:hypothetical protein
MRVLSVGSTPDDAATVVLTRAELRAIIGGLSEAIFEISPEEFAIRVGLPADEVKAFADEVLAVRKDYDARTGRAAVGDDAEGLE